MKWTWKYSDRICLAWSYGNTYYDSDMKEIPWLDKMFSISKNGLANTLYKLHDKVILN